MSLDSDGLWRPVIELPPRPRSPRGCGSGSGSAGSTSGQSGSRNIGATNTMRVLGKPLGAAALTGDVLKGLLPVILFARLHSDTTFLLLCGVAAILGHSFSLFLKFRGGKVWPPAPGSSSVWSPGPTLLAIAIFAAVVAATRYVSLGSICASVSLAIPVWFVDTSHVVRIVVLLVALLIIIKHRANVQRILKGEENRVAGRGQVSPAASPADMHSSLKPSPRSPINVRVIPQLRGVPDIGGFSFARYWVFAFAETTAPSRYTVEMRFERKLTPPLNRGDFRVAGVAGIIALLVYTCTLARRSRARTAANSSAPPGPSGSPTRRAIPSGPSSPMPLRGSPLETPPGASISSPPHAGPVPSRFSVLAALSLTRNRMGSRQRP